MSKADFTFDTSKFERSLKRFAFHSRKSGAEVLKNQARLLVRDAVALTPPNSGKGAGGKKRGEAAIAGDMFGGRTVNVGGFRAKARGFFEIMQKPGIERDEIVSFLTTKDGRVYGVEKRLYRPNASAGEMIAHRDQYRSKSTGQMSKAGLRTLDVGRHRFIDRMVVTPAAANRMLKELYRRVGYLAGGWNAAAKKLGLRLPNWIANKTANNGACIEVLAGNQLSITISNKVRFAGKVKGLRSRIQSALNNRARAMDRQLRDMALKGAAKRAGF
jgi:hypothetical protein